MVRWCSLVRVERREMKQLFHRKAGIESQSPVVTLMRASVRAPEGRWQQRPGSAHPIFFWKWKWKSCMYACMQCDSAGAWVGGGEGGRILYTVYIYMISLAVATAHNINIFNHPDLCLPIDFAYQQSTRLS